MIHHSLVTTAFEIPGYRISQNKGIARGIIVRSRSIVGMFFAGLQTLVGGNITLYTSLCERARSDAYDLMVGNAVVMGGNAIIAARFDATEIGQGLTEVLCYGTAVVVQPA